MWKKNKNNKKQNKEKIWFLQKGVKQMKKDLIKNSQ